MTPHLYLVFSKTIVTKILSISKTYVVHEFSHHAVPLACALLYCAILSVLHQLDLITESENSCKLTQQVHTIALEAIIATKWFI